MPKTHLPGHLDSFRTKLRPKHQLLVLKCYPRLPSNSAADAIKPNGSELSYLLYYASTRKSKLQKVGEFLERKTARDVYNQQSARVLITLHITTALLENKTEASGLALLAPYVMRIISGILSNTNDISLIEATLNTWHVFCRHQDQALLAADHEYRELFEKVVTQYAQLAQKSGAKKLGKATQPVAAHDATRLRQIGLCATKSVIESDAAVLEGGKQLLSETVPAILGNLRSEDSQYLKHLLRLQKSKAEDNTDNAIARRQSMATVRTYSGMIRTHSGMVDASQEADPRAAQGTAQDADKLAEEAVALLALECLKAVFSSDNRAQVRIGAKAVLEYLSEIQHYRHPQHGKAFDSTPDTWAMKIFNLCTAWTPVQDRFILMITAVEMMEKLPISEPGVRERHMYACMIGDVLRSPDLNLVGLSVIDVQRSMLEQLRRILVWYEDKTRPQTQATMAADATSDSDVREDITSDAVPTIITSEAKAKTQQSGTTASKAALGSEVRGDAGLTPINSEAVIRFCNDVVDCVGNLAVHVYYTDQIIDQVIDLLRQMAPDPAATLTAAENASNASPAHRNHRNSTSGYFNFPQGRKIVLGVITEVFDMANSDHSRNTSGGVAGNRNQATINIWDGSQWLLNDPYGDVRRGYRKAFAMWLRCETTKYDFKLESARVGKVKQRNDESAVANTMVRRALSNAGATKDRLRGNLKKTSSPHHFLQLLHQAQYENILQFAASSNEEVEDIQAMRTEMVRKLGLNEALSGIPMNFKLQEEMEKVQPPAKARINTVVQGYFKALVEVFGCEDKDVSSRELLIDAITDSQPAREAMKRPWGEPGANISRSVSGISKRPSEPQVPIGQSVGLGDGSERGEIEDEVEPEKPRVEIRAVLASINAKPVKKLGLGMKVPPY